MIYFNWIITTLYFLTLVGTTIAVLMDNRQPAKTMAWVLVLIFLPVIGLILFFFFGQNTHKERIISQQSLDELSVHSMLEFVEQKSLQLPERYIPLIKLFINQNFALPFKDYKAEILTSGYDYFQQLLVDILNARRHIHLCTYIFSSDALGNLVADALVAKAREGVEVRIVYDGVGCWRTSSKFFARMEEAGIQVYAFLPVHFPAFTSKINYRNHRKICVIDGRVGYVGGMNIADRYVKGTHRQAWRDTHLRVQGGLVYGLQRAFFVDWYFVSRELITDQKYYPSSVAEPSWSAPTAVAQVVTSSPVMEWPIIMQGYVRAMGEASRYIYIESPYFLPNETVLFAMISAARSGVDVRLMVPLHSDAKLVEWAGSGYLSQVAEAGVKVYFYKAGFNHSKLLIVDDELCSCGSTNVDFRSFENNCEANIFFYDSEMATRMKQVFLDDLAHCLPYEEVPHRFRRPFVQRLWESFTRMFAPML